MKIGVVTFWRGDSNYGMIMQCWALQEYLKMHGHNPFVIRYDTEGNLLKRYTKQLLHHIGYLSKYDGIRVLLNDYRIRKEKKQKDKKRNFAEFRKKYFNFSFLSYHYIEKIRLFPPQADCYISGSDQIWRGSLRFNNIKGFFLDFGNSSIRRIAYAPSFGMREYYQGEYDMLHRALEKYDYISCREYDGVAICERAGVSATKVVDPTLLLSSDYYNQLCTHKKNSDYFFIYSLNIKEPADIYWRYLKKTFPDKKFVVTPADGYFPGEELFGSEVTYCYATPYEWLSFIRDAEIVITSSFHGVVFSIIFNVKFAYIPLKNEMSSSNNRVIELLQQLNLNYSIIEDGNDYERIYKMNYNWESVNKELDKLRTLSSDFLYNSLL